MKIFTNHRIITSIGILLFLIGVGCSPEPAEFKRITNARIVSSDGDIARVKADALFYNPNKRSGQVKKVDIVVHYKDQEMAQISEESSVKVEGLKDFVIPLDVNLDLKKLQDNWLSNLVNILQDKSVELRFTGSIKVKFHGIGYNIPVDYTEKIKL
jgi:LEA14-like dessication related protein